MFLPLLGRFFVVAAREVQGKEVWDKKMEVLVLKYVCLAIALFENLRFWSWTNYCFGILWTTKRRLMKVFLNFQSGEFLKMVFRVNFSTIWLVSTQDNPRKKWKEIQLYQCGEFLRKWWVLYLIAFSLLL